ncbi:hypothetical protein Ahy_A04g018673 [Arachis hypogaea]|uniref:AAA ATPase AAA+ lid domain-containing protein n=1 Tax=Arachis hypogaea TaxID=3818 RepID=A0A445DE84_ARAHY|nr:hypothetical protein Ahy_A04g018673 [Arachis hypogaea]
MARNFDDMFNEALYGKRRRQDNTLIDSWIDEWAINRNWDEFPTGDGLRNIHKRCNVGGSGHWLWLVAIDHNLTSPPPYRPPFTYTKSQIKRVVPLSFNELLRRAQASSSSFLTHSATAATFSFFSSLLNTEPVSSSTSAPPVAASVPTTAAPLSLFLSPLSSGSHIFSASQPSSPPIERKQKGKDVEGEDVCRLHVPTISCRSYLLQNSTRLKLKSPKDSSYLLNLQKLPAIVNGSFKLFERMYGVALELNSHQIMLLLLWIVWWQGRMLLQEGTLMLLREKHIGKRLYIDLPDAKQRVQIFGVHSSGKQLAKDVDFEKLVFRTVGFSGADIKNLVNEAAIMMLLPGGNVCYLVTAICKMIILDFCHSFCLCSSSLPIKKL